MSKPTSFRIGLFRRARPRAPADVGVSIHAVLRALGEHHPACERWFVIDRGFEARRCRSSEDVSRHVRAAEIEWDAGMRAPDAPAFEARFFNMVQDGHSVNVVAAFALDGDPLGPHWGLRVDAELGVAFGVGSPPEGAQRLRELFATCVKVLEPDWAFLGTPRLPAPVGRRVSAGWLTYVAGAAMPGRLPGKPAEVARLDSLGHVIVAHPELMDGDVPAHVEAVRAVQRALDGEDDAPSAPVVRQAVSDSPWTRWARRPGTPGRATTDPGSGPIDAPIPGTGHEADPMPSYLHQAPPSLEPPPAPALVGAPHGALPPPGAHAPGFAAPASGSDLAGTAHMDLRAIVAAVKRGESPLPFNASEASTPNTDRAPPARPAVELPSRPPLSGTVEADLSAVIASVKRGALPFSASRDSSPQSTAAPGSDIDFAQFPLETYASVAGALARGEPRDAVLARHAMSSDAYDRMAKAWAQRFQREPQMLARFQELARSNAAAPRRAE